MKSCDTVVVVVVLVVVVVAVVVVTPLTHAFVHHACGCFFKQHDCQPFWDNGPEDTGTLEPWTPCITPRPSRYHRWPTHLGIQLALRWHYHTSCVVCDSCCNHRP